MSRAIEVAAELVAERKLVERYPEEYARYLREAGHEMVTVFRTTYREVTEDEAEILCRHGWSLMEGN